MHRIEIKNFGPVADVEMDVANVTFLLGEQASGKSTIAKLIYFFRTWQDEFISIVANDFETWSSCRTAFKSLLRSKFVNLFGATANLGRFEITYRYSPSVSVGITPNEVRQVNIKLGSLLPTLKRIWEIRARERLNTDNGAPINGLRSKTRSLFNDDYYPVYIPAGRAFLSRETLYQVIMNYEASALNERIRDYGPFDVVDAPTRRFISEVGNVRRWLAAPAVDIDLPEYLSKTSGSILKGTYVRRRERDFIKLADKQLVPLSYSSSGQQEVVWLLNMLLYYTAIGQKCFVIIEEPEAHLHPDAQYLLVKYIVAFINLTGSQSLITTHSPYILSSCNNLLYADKCGRNPDNATAVKSIIEQDCWLSSDNVDAYIMEEGSIIDIKDERLTLIEIDRLDSVASGQDDEYEKLCRISRGRQ